MSEHQARAVGRLASRSRHEDVVDLAVVEGALRRRDAIVTSDPEESGTSQRQSANAYDSNPW